jgi:hypothetical protein
MSPCFGLAALALAPAVVLSLPAPALTAPITLVWVDPDDRASIAAEDAMEEAVAVLREAGAEVRWRRADPLGLLGAEELAVIMVAAPRENERRVMGAAPLTTSAPAVWVHPDAVGEVIGLERRAPSGWTARERVVFARALGRVAAHEVVHAILGSPRHASAGLMSRSLQGPDLLAPFLYVDSGTRRAVVRAVAAPYRWAAR